MRQLSYSKPISWLSFHLFVMSIDGLITYNPENQICCNRKLYKRSNFDYPVGCCRGNGMLRDRLYNTENETCTMGSEQNKLLIGKTDMECCDSDNTNYVYGINRLSEILCCDGVPHKTNHKDTYRCCGSHIYDVSNQICCQDEEGNNKIHPTNHSVQCCGTEVFDVRTHVCVDKKILPHGNTLCGEKTIDDLFHICCNGIVHSRIGDKGQNFCCDKTTYNPQLNDCDRNKVVDKGKRRCEDGQFDPDYQICCDGKVHNNAYGNRALCCGTELIDSSLFYCCSKTKFDFESFQCCGGKILNISSHCCAGEVLNTTSQICCPQTFEKREHIIQKALDNHTDCCPSRLGGRSYSKVDSYCSYQGNVMPKGKPANICGNTKYDVQKDLCCNYFVFKNARSKGLRCCYPGRRVYNPRKQVCCDSVPVNGYSCRPPCKSKCRLTDRRRFLKHVRCRRKVFVIYSTSTRQKRLWSKQALMVRAGQRTYRRASKFQLLKGCNCLPDGKLFILMKGTKRTKNVSLILTKYSVSMANKILRRQRKICRRIGR